MIDSIMTKTILTVLFVTTILLTSLIVTSVDFADATKAQGKPSAVVRSSLVCGDRLCSEPVAPEPVKPVEEEAMEEEVMVEEVMEEKMAHPMWQTASGTLTSMVDPGIGHEDHQLVIILPPTDKVYKGILTYSASEPIEFVALHGPLAPGEDAGQAIWTPDGDTKFALTFMADQPQMGSWLFSGNALAVHTMNTETFTVSYSVSYVEKEMSDTVKTGTLTSMIDPGIGHESHQLAIILPPSDDLYSGLLTYSASEPIEFVALHGPLAPGEDAGQAIWTPDGDTKFALTFMADQPEMGTWLFAGNALAVHTMNTETFTVSYSVVAGQ